VLSTSLVTALIEIGETSDGKRAERIRKRYSKLFNDSVQQIAMVMHDTGNHWAGVTISNAGKISIFNLNGAHGNPAFLTQATQITTAIGLITAGWEGFDTESRTTVFCPQQKTGSNNCGLFAKWFIATIREHGAWSEFSAATLPLRFQRDTVIESLLHLIEKAYNIMIRLSLDVVYAKLGDPHPMLSPPPKSIASGLLFDTEWPGYVDEDIDTGVPASSYNDNPLAPPQPNLHAWDANRLPDNLDLDAPLRRDQLHADGKRFPNVPASFSPLQVQCITKSRLFTTPIRSQMERVQYLLDRYSHVIEVACCRGRSGL
jgi:hypothetical protein